MIEKERRNYLPAVKEWFTKKLERKLEVVGIDFHRRTEFIKTISAHTASIKKEEDDKEKEAQTSEQRNQEAECLR